MAIDGAAWLGFSGVVAGAALGYASSAAQEGARRRHDERRARQEEEREDRIRFEDRRFDAYVAVIDTANRLYAAVKYPAAARAELGDGGRGGRQPAGHDPYLDRLHLAYAQFRSALSPAFMMTRSDRTRGCIAALAEAVRELFRGATHTGQPGDGALGPLYYGHRRALRAAEAAMRAEFGIVADAPDDPG